ncbi:MAG: S8 family serine peptidase [Elusimicrobia bacterium]|nr:S8 family serine peptidase [Elusimicrobiota bacterium]
MKKNQSALIAVFISLCVAGPSAYGQTITGRTAAPAGSGVNGQVIVPVVGGGQVGAVSMDIKAVSLQSVTPVLAVPQIRRAPAGLKAGEALALPSEAQAVLRSPETAVGFAGQAKSGSGSKSSRLRQGRRGMPEEGQPDRDRGSPDSTDDLDGLGNPGRRQDDGPDSVSDEFGGDSGSRGVAEFLKIKDALTIGSADIGRMAADQARASGQAIMDRALGVRPVRTSGGAVQAMPSGGSADQARSSLSRAGLKSSRKGMPDEGRPDRDGGSPDSTDGLDELGNPSRRQDDGPDSVSDEFGGGRGGDGNAGLLAPGMVETQIGMTAAPQRARSAPQAAAADVPVDLVVMLAAGEGRRLTADSFLSSVDLEGRQGVQAYAEMQGGMLAQLEAFGIGQDALASLDATPTATYRRINAAVFRVGASKAAEFVLYMNSQGHKVFANDSRKIIKPVPTTPENADPNAPKAVTLEDTLKIIQAVKVHQAAAELWGPSELGPVGRLAMKAATWLTRKKADAPQPPIAVIDSGADVGHPMLKNVKTFNATSGENVDDIGHGSWVTSAVLNIARWLKNVTHYKTFLNGGASLDDILKALTQAANDGNIVMSNSWGSDDGDPDSPDSQLVRKLAEEGRIMVFAAGNSGPGANTVGSPAIVYYKDAKTGAVRVLAVAAANRSKKIASFSSRGPGSEKTKDIPGYPHRPDLTSVGYNKEGAWPSALGDADRTDPVYGPLKAISGTSMSTPDVAGAIAMLAQLFGVTRVGEKLDAVVNAVMSTLEKTGQSPDMEGDGFINVDGAYELLKKSMEPVRPGFVARLAAKVAGWMGR